MEAATIVGQQAIRFVQLTFIPIMFLIIFIGFFLFLTALKNPHRKRKGFLFAIGGSIGLFLITYGPLLVLYIKSGGQTVETSGAIYMLSESTKNIGWTIFDAFASITEPIIFSMFYIGIGMWLMAAKNPVRKRLGMASIVGSPVLWVLFQYADSIYNFFV